MKKLIFQKQKINLKNMSKNKLSDYFNQKPYQITTNLYKSPYLPECEILVNKQLRKVYGNKKNKIYLNNDDYIQINIFNPTFERIGVQLEFNGSLENKMLIVNPGQKILLDRFVDTKKKIKFSTYFIDKNNKLSKKAIEKNGSITIHFWKEKNNTQLNISSTTRTWINYDDIQTYPLNNYNSILNNITTSNNTYQSHTTSNTSNLDNLLETGRLEKGEKSKQKMNDVYFESDYIFHSQKFKLLPFSQMKEKKKSIPDNIKPEYISVDSHNNYYKNTDHRIYCSNPLCGYRIRNRNWKFCPVCGNDIE
jgi:hypothetical protein